MFLFVKTGFNKLMGLKAVKGFMPPLREVLSEDGIGSYSRYTGFLIVIFTLFWVTYLVFHNHAFPDMDGPTAFVAGGQSAYAANQVKRIAAAAKTGIVMVQTPNPTVTQTPGDSNDPTKP